MGSLDAKYEYGAFGEPLRVSGTAIAEDNPFRFSTKYTDTDGARERVDGDAEGVARRAEEAGAPWALMRQTGLVYYGFRYNSPSLGRFLNRDPFGEEGGSNLYGFVENDPVNGWDYLGLDRRGDSAEATGDLQIDTNGVVYPFPIVAADGALSIRDSDLRPDLGDGQIPAVSDTFVANPDGYFVTDGQTTGTADTAD